MDTVGWRVRGVNSFPNAGMESEMQNSENVLLRLNVQHSLGRAFSGGSSFVKQQLKQSGS